MKKLVSIVSLLLLLAAPARAQVWSDVRHPDLATATDLVLVAEGYAAGEEGLFLEKAREAVAELDGDADARPLLDARRINFHFVFVPSRAAPSSERATGPVDSACRAWIRDDGLLVADDAAVERFAAAAPDVDAVCALIHFARGRSVRSNADVLPGAAGRIRLDDRDTSAFLHELGHALLGVGDEYAEESRLPAEALARIATFPNLSTDPSGRRWAHIVSTKHEGGGGYRRGVWRAERDCRMRSCRSEAFCRVCLAQLAPVGAPTPPVIDSPREGARVAPGVVTTWRPTGTVYPAGYYLILYRRGPGGDVAVLRTAAEAHVRSADLGSLPAGSYLLGLSAQTRAGLSKTTWRAFAVEGQPAPASGRPAGVGLAGAVRRS
jgi:hypothetical protein